MIAGGQAPRLSVVVPVLNAGDTIAAQLQALASQRWSEPWEVVIADNGSSDDSRDVVDRFRGDLPGLRVVDASARRGAAHALNVGVREARGRSVAFSDADDEVGDDWLAAIGAALEEHEFVACRGDVERLNEPWVQETRVVEVEQLSNSWFPPFLPIAGAGGLGVRRELHLRNEFDESLLGLFDVEYCLRLQLAGHDLVYLPHAVVHMRFRSRWREIFSQARHYAEYGAALQRRFKAEDDRFPGRLRWLGSGGKPLLRTLPRAWRRADRAKLAWMLGWQLGRFRGSIRHRVLAV